MKLVYILSFISTLFFLSSSLSAENIVNKTKRLQKELLSAMAQMRSMVSNFPCSPFPECLTEAGAIEQGDKTNFLKRYKDAQAVYQEALLYYYEGNFLNSYERFFSLQADIDKLLEELSQSYLERTQEVLREAVEKKIPEDPSDRSLSKVILEYTQDAQRNRAFQENRESPHTKRSYDPKETTWVKNKYRLVNNLRKAYENLSLAKQARLRAFRLLSQAKALPLFEEREKTLALTRESASEPENQEIVSLKEQKITPEQGRKRVDFYLKSIRLCRKAKANAGFIFMFKYPYDNYALQNPYGKTEKGRYEEVHVPSIENIRMKWAENPYVNLKNLHPVLDLRFPAKFRRDFVDVRDEIYEEQMDRLVRLKKTEKKPESFQEISIQEQQRTQ